MQWNVNNYQQSPSPSPSWYLDIPVNAMNKQKIMPYFFGKRYSAIIQKNVFFSISRPRSRHLISMRGD